MDKRFANSQTSESEGRKPMTEVLSGIPKGNILCPIVFTFFFFFFFLTTCPIVFKAVVKSLLTIQKIMIELIMLIEYRRTSLEYRDGQIFGIYVLMLLNVKSCT